MISCFQSQRLAGGRREGVHIAAAQIAGHRDPELCPRVCESFLLLEQLPITSVCSSIIWNFVNLLLPGILLDLGCLGPSHLCPTPLRDSDADLLGTCWLERMN